MQIFFFFLSHYYHNSRLQILKYDLDFNITEWSTLIYSNSPLHHKFLKWFEIWIEKTSFQQFQLLYGSSFEIKYGLRTEKLATDLWNINVIVFEQIWFELKKLKYKISVTYCFQHYKLNLLKKNKIVMNKLRWTKIVKRYFMFETFNWEISLINLIQNYCGYGSFSFCDTVSTNSTCILCTYYHLVCTKPNDITWHFSRIFAKSLYDLAFLINNCIFTNFS